MTIKFSVLAAAIMASAMIATPSFAADNADNGFYAVGALGGSYIDSDIDKVEDIGAEYSEWNKGSFAAKIAAGYQFNRNFALEGGYYYLGKTDAKVSDNGNYIKYELTGHLIGVEGVGILPLNDVFSLFGKAGAGVAITKAKLSSNISEINDSVNKTRIVPILGAGMEWNLTPKLALRTEYEGVFGVSKEEDSGFDTNFHLFTVGMKYKF